MSTSDLAPLGSTAYTHKLNQPHAYRYGVSPAGYVDDAKPLANPCSQDGSLEANTTQATCKVYVFYHLYVDNAWREILIDQLIKLLFSSLYDRATVVYATISGNDALTIAKAAHLVGTFGRKFTVLHQHLHNAQYERATLQEIKEHISDDDLIYYFHLKGALLLSPLGS